MKIRTDLTHSLLRMAAAAGVAIPGVLLAQPSAHYVPGIEGIKAASLPPPGIYLRDYNVAYYSDTLNDARGNKIDGLEAEAFIYANVPRLVWITDAQVLGGYLGVDALLPLQYTDLEVKANRNTLFDDDTFGIGDFFVEGTWSKHIQQFDFSLGYGIWAPTGDSSPRLTTRAGLGYWAHMFTAGVTYYTDPDKKCAISVLNRYEINHEKYETDITPGQAYTLEYGISYSVAPTVDLGVAGYYQEQVTEDRGWNAGDERDRVAGIGPEFSVAYPDYMLSWSFRYAYEFLAESRFQGHTFALTLTKRF
ncbi:MAG TPA: transporter [Clostridia bacterium]|nr:transporter [Clostridia bacterium]